MTFVNTLFPNPRLIHDLAISKTRPVTVVGNNYTSQRISKQRNYLKRWVWPSRAMLSTDRIITENFVQDVAQFGQNSFKYQDPSGSFWNTVQLQWAGSGNLFKLTERGLDDHPIYHLGNDVTVKLGAATVAVGARSIYAGIPVIAVPGATSGSSVTISGTFYYAVRLDAAEFSYSMTALDGSNRAFADTIDDIMLIECFEY